MDRRLLIGALACWPAALLRAQGGEQRPRRVISAGQLHDALSARFPRRLGLPGLLELQVSAPRLLLLPARNKLGASLAVQAEGPGMPPLPPGELDVVFALRYEAADRSVRGHDPEILDVRLPGLPPEFARTLQRALPAMTREAMGEVLLHTFSPGELALPDAMGFEPGPLTVQERGLLVEFVPKPRP